MVNIRKSDERGVALILSLFLAIIVAGMAVGVILMAGNASLIAKFHADEATMESAADAGLEIGRDTLNGTPNIVPVGAGFVTLQINQPVRDAAGNIIPGISRSLYAGPNGDTTGQYGEFASIISVISNTRGAVVVRRMQLKQDSFSRFARFFNTWTCCMWGNQETVFGPVHSNQGMAVQSRGGYPGATFWGPVSVVTSVSNYTQGNWNGGLTQGAPSIPFPSTQTLANLQSFATTSQTVVTGYGNVNDSVPDTRIEFVPVDMNGDGDVTDANEGFFRVFQATAGGTQQDKRDYINARKWNLTRTPPGGWPTSTSSSTDQNFTSPNCGGFLNIGGTQDWFRADSVWQMRAALGGNNAARDSIRKMMGGVAGFGGGRRCFPGGDYRLYGDSSRAVLADAYGQWLPWAGWGGAPPASLVNAIIATGVPAGSATAVADTYWPLTRQMNPNFKGIIYVNGSVALSGVLRGRVTVVATGNIALIDDITYTTAPGTNCWDILGVLTQLNAYISNNNVNGVFEVNNTWRGFDDSPNETFNGFFLTLQKMIGEYYTAPSEPLVAPEACGGASRGCKVLVGGTIQQGIAATYSGTTGWAEADTYDQCGVSAPPPYYPTTGRFTKNRYYEIDPVGFNVATWFANNQ
ncbi:MAG: hypothetical protein AB7Q69_05975 [Gemmatimonadales bacterium]